MKKKDDKKKGMESKEKSPEKDCQREDKNCD